MQISWKTRSKLYGVCLEAWTHHSWGKRSAAGDCFCHSKASCANNIVPNKRFWASFPLHPPKLTCGGHPAVEGSTGRVTAGVWNSTENARQTFVKKKISKNNKNACCDSKVFPVQCEQQHLRRTLSIMGPNKTAPCIFLCASPGH